VSGRGDDDPCGPPPAGGLGPDRVLVRTERFPDHAARAEALAATLSPSERARAAAFAFPRERERFAISRGLLRALLARFAGGSPASQEIVEGPHGKPALAGSCGQGRVRFSVSHSGDLWGCAVGFRREVGLDLEAVDPARDHARLAERYFSPAEAAALAALPPGERNGAFHRCWTRKEAWLKCLGFGLHLPLDGFEVSLRSGEPAALLAVRFDPGVPGPWRLVDLDLGPGFAACLAVEGAGAFEVGAAGA
jgi:4'-phosphopantetheinyl transferase